MKKKSSKDIRNFIIIIFALLMCTLIGLIVFLFTVDIKVNKMMTYDRSSQEDEKDVMDSSKNINLSNYELIQKSSDENIEVKLLSGKVFINLKYEEKNYNDLEINVKENIIQDIFIGKIDKENYLVVITDNGSIGVMKIDEAIEKNRFEINDELITFEKQVVRLENANMKLDNGSIETIIVFTTDGMKFDLSDFAK